jgi:tetratricopeptide (TPR) repeat protein
VSSDKKKLDKARRLLREGRLRDAYQICSSLVDSDKGNIDAWHILSNIQLRAGQMDDAISSARWASELAPDRPEQLIHLGSCLAAAGRTGEALAVGEQASRLDLSSPADLSNLGTLSSMCNDHLRAAEYFERAIQGDGGNAEYWYNLASAQRMLGELDKAEESCNKAIALNPHDGQAHYLRSDLGTQSPEANHVADLKSLLSANGQSTQNRMLGGFALAKELEDIGEYEESFAFLRTATESYRNSIKYDVSDDIAVIEQIIARHTAEALNSTSPGYEGDAPVFIVGLPRSGTTLVERIIQSHSQVISVGERNDFALEMSRRAARKCTTRKPSRNELVAAALQIDMAELGRAYADRIRAISGGAARIIDKMPINYLYCGLIHAVLPNAQIVSLMRDPMDSCYAAYKAFLRGPYSFTYDLDELGHYYLAFRRLMEHWRASLPQTAYLEVQYESLVSDFEKEARRIIEFLDLPWEDQVLEYQKSSAASATASAVQVRRGVYSSSVGKWKNYVNELEPLRQVLAQEIDTLR